MKQSDLPFTEAEKRDEALQRLEDARPQLIKTARQIARQMALRHGSVTSTEVLAEMRLDPGLARQVADADRRFMGPVFRDKGWRRLGWEPSGSHCRPVARWTLRP